MAGILLICIALAWIATVLRICKWIAGRFNSVVMKAASYLVLLPALVIAPMTDELVGKDQFGALCRKYAVQTIDEQHAMNRQVVYVPRGADQFAQGTWVEIRIDPILYRDAETGAALVSYHTLHAKGGWLVRAIGISGTDAPLLFSSGCAPEDQNAFKKKFNIKVIN